MSESRLERSSYNYYQLSPDTLAITIDVLDSGPGITVPTVPQPAAPLALTDPAIKLESRFARPTVDFIDVDFEVIEDPGRRTQSLATYNGDPLSDGGRGRRAPISRNAPFPTAGGGPGSGQAGGGSPADQFTPAKILPSAYDFLKAVETYIPPPCPEITVDALRDNLSDFTEETNRLIATANTAAELDKFVERTGNLVVGGLGLATALSTVFFPPATPFLAGATVKGVLYYQGTRLATTGTRIATDHIARNNLIHRARLTTTASFIPDPDGDPCAVAEPVLLRERPERNCDCVAAIPEFWPKRIGAERPQLVIQFAERFEDRTFGPPNLPVSIPWPKPDKVADPIETSPVGPYQKGNYWATLTLLDNSKITINAATLALAEDLVREAAEFVDPDLLPDPIEPKSGKRGGRPVIERVVFPKIARYFPDGQRDTYPKWEVYFD